MLWLASGCISPYLSNAELDADAEPGCKQDPDTLALVCSGTQACPAYTAAERIRIVDWNIKAGQLGLDAVIDTLRALDPDVVLLQEVDSEAERTGRVDQPQAIARSLGDDFDYVFAPTIELQGGTYGIAMLSRLPIRAASRISLSNLDSKEPRTATEAQLCAGRGELRVVNHHADTSETSAANSCFEIFDHMQRSAIHPSVFAGDLNQRPAAPGPSAAAGAGLHDVLAERDATPTFGDARIDYFFVDPQLTQHIVDARVIQTDASDHELLLMELFMGYSAPLTVSQWRLPH